MRTTKGARPIDASNLARRIREYMDDFPNATTRLATCRAILSILGDENQTPTLRTISRPNEWVSVEDRLPEFPGFLDHIMVVTYNKNGHVMPMVRERILVGYGWMERWLFPWNEIYDGPEITHWMPLPAPPEHRLPKTKKDSDL